MPNRDDKTMSTDDVMRQPLQLAPVPKVFAERFRWEALDRTTDTTYREDENQLGSWTLLNPWNISRISLIELVPAVSGQFGYHHEVPEGAKAVFTRRRVVTLGQGRQPGWTIIGHAWPDGDSRQAEYFFFKEDEDFVIKSNDFNAV